MTRDTCFCCLLRFANRVRELFHFDRVVCVYLHCICVMQSFFFFDTCRPSTSRALTRVQRSCIYIKAIYNTYIKSTEQNSHWIGFDESSLQSKRFFTVAISLSIQNHIFYVCHYVICVRMRIMQINHQFPKVLYTDCIKQNIIERFQCLNAIFNFHYSMSLTHLSNLKRLLIIFLFSLQFP